MTVTITGGLTINGGGLTFAPSGAAANDPYFMYNSLLLPGNGTNLAQNNTFLDGSTNNFTITRAGNTTQGTFSPYGANWSNYFDGTGDYLTVPSSSAFQITGDFTIEAWVYATSINTYQNIMSQYQNSTNSFACGYNSTQGWYFNYANNAAEVTNYRAGSSPLNTWTHVAFVKSSTTMTVYVNGTALASTITVPNLPLLSSTLNIGIWAGALDSLWNGYISNLRMVKGTAVYTGNFTPSTTPLTAIANTSLLTCQSNRFIDNSTNAFAITVNGNTNIQRFSPFEPSAAYDTSTIGGSGYFDGTGDYLTIARSNLLIPVANENFTIESWVYLTQSADQQIAGFHTQGVSSDWVLTISSTNYPQFYISATSTLMISSIAVRLNTWNHIAVVRTNTNTITLYVNGVAGATTTTTSTMVGNGSNPLTIGSDYNGVAWRYMGYISDIRIVKGTAVYTSAFTPPTAPVTAIANTNLLVNYTNAGIIDNAMMNNLETVGNAQISTAQTKFGGGSMAFDGTGDYLTAPFSVANQFGTGDFTIEFWLYRAGGSIYQTILDTRSSGTASPWAVLLNSSNQPYILISSDITSSIAVASATWTHIAICRASGTLRIFNDGVMGYSGANSTSMMPTGPLRIGKTIDNVYDLNGYIDDLRITKGYARYTANFTPPTSALPTY